MRLIGRSSGRVALTVNSCAPRRYVAPAGRALLFAVLGNGRAGDGTTCRSLIYGSTSSMAASPSAIHPWRLFRPDSHGAHGHWVSNARNALDSGRTGERGGGQHPTHTSPSTRSEAVGRPARILHVPHLRSCRSWLTAVGDEPSSDRLGRTALQDWVPPFELGG